MAAIKFYPNLKKGKSKIYVRVTIKRGQDFRVSTMQSIEDASKWNHQSGYPKKSTAQNKKLFDDLYKLEKEIESKISEIESSQIESTNDISSKWVKELILNHFNETPMTDENLLVPFAKSFSKSLHNKTYIRNGRRIRYSRSTINKYMNFAKVLEEYENYLKQPIKISSVNDQFSNAFLTYLMEEKDRSVNTRGRYAKRLKTIVKEAELAGIKVDIKYKHIKGFEDETVVTFLTLEEIDHIIETPMPSERLGIAKDWLIVGCFTAQRISDLFRMKKNMITTRNGLSFISLKQYKTGKNVFIPISYHVESVLEKYDGEFPPNISENEQSNRTALSTLMKEVCKISGITEKVKGRFNGKIGIYPKYKLIQNHSCRRSFASNFYGREGWNNQMIMEITGHETEKNFLKYIDKDNFYLSERAAENFVKMKIENSKKNSRLKKVN